MAAPSSLKAELRLDEDALCRALEDALPASVAQPERARALEALSARAINYLCDEVESIERAVRAEIPQALHIDLEFDRARGNTAIRAAPPPA
jgi:hypothetical protein